MSANQRTKSAASSSLPGRKITCEPVRSGPNIGAARIAGRQSCEAAHGAPTPPRDEDPGLARASEDGLRSGQAGARGALEAIEDRREGLLDRHSRAVENEPSRAARETTW